MKFQNVYLIGLLVIFCLYANNTTASIIEKLDKKQLVQKASKIVVAKVLNIEYDWNEEHKIVFTSIKIDVHTFIKGNQEEKNINLLIPGGEAGGKKVTVSGTPKFKIGETVVLFLEPEIYNSYRVLGWRQGRFTINDNSEIIETKQPLSEFIDQINSILNESKFDN